MSERATVDYQVRLAHRATFVKNVADAKAHLLIAEANLIRAQAELEKYTKENK